LPLPCVDFLFAYAVQRSRACSEAQRPAGDVSQGSARASARGINPLALAESTFLFATLVPEAVRFGLALHNLGVGARVAVLTPGGLNSAGYQWNMHPREAPAGNAEFTVDLAGEWKPGEVAYQRAAQVYRWFGHTDEDVPYVDEAKDGTRTISNERILAHG
jgi:hypothetical protein